MEKETKKILIVEDDTAILDIYKTVFGKFGFEVESASSGKEALSIIEGIKKGESEKPVIVLLDLILPDMDGLDLLKAIKSNDVTKNIKVFIMTNKESIGSELPEDMKPDEFIVKANVTPIDIVELVKKHIGNKILNPKP